MGAGGAVPDAAEEFEARAGVFAGANPEVGEGRAGGGEGWAGGGEKHDQVGGGGGGTATAEAGLVAIARAKSTRGAMRRSRGPALKPSFWASGGPESAGRV